MEIHALVADDEPNQLELLTYNLSKAGFKVTKAQNGEEALELAEDIIPDIIILDWMMPIMSGIEVCRKLKNFQATKDIPVIILSARSEEGDRTLGLEIGADDYVSKPFSPRELIARIRAVLRRSRPALIRGDFKYKSLQLDTVKKMAKINGKKVYLSNKEFKILLLLIERPGQIFSRSQILDRVWGHDSFVSERTVDVHIARLKKVLTETAGDNETRDLFRTVRGEGYSLNTE